MSKARDQRGQILVIAAGGIVALLLVVGLTIDSGYAFFQRRSAQNIADTTALAGTQVVGENLLAIGRTTTSTMTNATVLTAVQDVANANGCAQPKCVITAAYVDKSRSGIGNIPNDSSSIPVQARGVRVTTTKNFDTYFLGVIGMPTWDAGAAATALAAQTALNAAGTLLPIAMYQEDAPLTTLPGATVNITSRNNQAPGPGNFGWLDWYPSSSSNATLSASVCVPDNPLIPVLPSNQYGNPGVQNSSTLVGCIDAYIANGTTVMIPLYSAVQSQGSNFQYTLVGVVAVRLLSYTHQAISLLTAEFLNFVPTPNGIPAASDIADTPNANPVFYGLVE